MLDLSDPFSGTYSIDACRPLTDVLAAIEATPI